MIFLARFALLGVLVSAFSYGDLLVSEKASEVSLTVYRATADSTFDLSDGDAIAYGIAMVTETRDLDLPAGESDIQFQSIAQTIVPQSALLENLTGDIKEVNFDYNLLAPSSLFQQFVGESIRLVKTHPKTGKVSEEQAVLLSGRSGYLLQFSNRIETLNCSGEHEKIIFPHLPKNLSSTPLLSAKVNVAKAGKYSLQLSYLATGFDWVTHYVATTDPLTNKLQLTGWLSLVNQQDMSLQNAAVDVVAGDVSRDDSTEPVKTSVAQLQKGCWYPVAKKFKLNKTDIGRFPDVYMADSLQRMAGVEEIAVMGARAAIAEAKELGDYKLYHLPFKTDVNAHQIKQVQLANLQNVKYEKRFVFEFDDQNFSAINDESSQLEYQDTLVFNPETLLRLINKKSEGLGQALPAGGVSVYEPSVNGQGLVLSGEDRIKDAPLNLPIDIKIGTADKVEIQVIPVKEINVDGSKTLSSATDIEIIVTNHSTESALVDIRPKAYFYNQNKRFAHASAKSTFYKGVPVWTLRVAAGKQQKLSFRVEELY